MDTEKETMILGAYKEPLAKVEGGFGYMGAISLNTEGQIQCHICGLCFENISFHLRVHRISVKEYKEKFGLMRQSKLISEKERERLKIRMFQNKLMWGEEKVRENLKKAIEGRKQYALNNPAKLKSDQTLKLEQKNLRGICPEQLLKLITDCAEKLERTPSYDDFVSFYGTQRFWRPIKRTFGSWLNAVKKANLAPLIEKRGGVNLPRYSDEELLEYLSDFYRENKSIPSRTDFIRGLLPHFTLYLRRFGSIVEARRLAGIEEYGSQKGKRKEIFANLVPNH